jgi:hypothetical protein
MILIAFKWKYETAYLSSTAAAMGWKARLQFPAGTTIFLFTLAYKPALDLTQPPI